MSNAELPLTLKVDLSGDVRRCRNFPPAGAEPAFEALLEAVRSLFALPAGAPLALQYHDEENDLCSLVEATFADALEQGKAAGGVLRLVASQSPASPSASPSKAPVAEVPLTAEAPASESEAPAAAAPTFADGIAAAPPGLGQLTEAVAAASSSALASASAADPPAAGALQEVTRTTSGCAVFERLQRAQPKLSEQFSSFTQQLQGDFKENRKDMKEAFLGGASEDDAPALRKIGNVVGFAAGLVVAARMAPVRVTRLAAESAAAISGASADAEGAAPAPAAAPTAEPTPRSEGSDAVVAAPDLAGATSATDAAIDSELNYFTEQVRQDFHSVRKEVRDILGYVLGGNTSVGGLPSPQPQQPLVESDQDEQLGSSLLAHPAPEEQGQAQGFRDAIPSLASNLAGFAVAAQLVPFRAARLVVSAGGRGI
eukprot:CAMPEP_0203952722 /NCGR_PEP_ID=MMETSP0359-20131031/86296_1 /ASSEMBLY_ACC=CAM_ASM_000338 /TAXON_ID=268821 /ORGANISM="Scrippsiella Hangoei, Strain SHTV-5" /LENGTH=427 /DNA_ID=CAMNT_0050885809 /DNA_START=82 /DNA_END=1362 /DNA_ORIENTATION=-